MTIEQVDRLHTARPFRPFRIHVADGRQLNVMHPEFLARTGAGRTIFVGSESDAFEIVDLLLVTSLEVQEQDRSGRGRPRGS